MEPPSSPEVQSESPASAAGSKRHRPESESEPGLEPESEPSSDLYFGATANELILALPYVYNPELISVDGLTSEDDEDEDDRFFRQVRQSKGYDVDSFPSENWNSPYSPLFLNCGYKPHDRLAYATAEFAIAKINEHDKKNYSVSKILKAVASRTYTVFLTFNAFEDDGTPFEDVGDDETVLVETFRAMVAWDSNPEKMELMEYKLLYSDGSWGDLKVLNGNTVLPNGALSV